MSSVNIHTISNKEKNNYEFKLEFTTPQKVNNKYVSYISESLATSESNKNILFQFNAIFNSNKLKHDLTIFSYVEDLCSKGCEEYSLQWFGKLFNPATIQSNYCPSYTESTLNINIDDDTKYFDKFSNKINSLNDNTEITCLVEPKYIWFSRNNWGVHWYLHQAKIINKFKLKEFCIIDDPEDEVEEDLSDDNNFFNDII